MDYSGLYLTVSRIGVIHTYQEGLLFTKNERGEFSPAYLCCFIADGPDNNYHYVVPEGNYILRLLYKRKGKTATEKVMGLFAEERSDTS